MRHNALHDVEANLMQKVCTDVKIEPMLVPTGAELATSTTADRARLDVSGLGLWNQYEETYTDIMVTPHRPVACRKKVRWYSRRHMPPPLRQSGVQIYVTSFRLQKPTG